jgi:hypothetical protein
MASKRQHDRASAIASAIGGEPDSKILVDDQNYLSNFMDICNWYSANKVRKDCIKYHADYIKKNRPGDLELLPYLSDQDYTTTMGWLCRVQMRGGNISSEHKQRFDKYLDELVAKAQVNKRSSSIVAPSEPRKVIDIQAAMAEKIQEYIGELEGELDEVFFQGKDLNLYNFMKARQTPAAYVPEIREWSKKYLEQYLEVLKDEDEQLKEGYSNFSKKQIRDLSKMFHSFIEDCDKYEVFKKANRKPRAVKEKTPAQQVKGIKYKIKDEELNISSVSPADMIGASQVWLYNTKTKKLSKYGTDSSRGITAKGSAIQNWDPEMSKQKTLRKPAEQLKELMESGKVKMRTFLDNIKTKEQNVNGRLNTDTIILKVVK